MGEKKRYLQIRLHNQETEQEKEHYHFPLYGDCYKDALRCIFLRALREESEDSAGLQQWYQNDVSNMIAFLGKRGSGKTTAMAEFGRILEGINVEKEFHWWLSACMNDEHERELKSHPFYFKVMEPIDASRLEAKEDLFELILAQIYQEYERQNKAKFSYFKSQSNQDREKLEQFSRIFRSYHALRIATGEEEFSESIIAKFQYMSSSMEIRKNIEELIGALLVDWSEKSCRNRYLVIVIDDLDLNIKNGYDMLEQLHKYFWNKHIIIVLAVDYEQINVISETSFWKDLNATLGSAAVPFLQRENVSAQGKRISVDYMTKVLPIDNRIFMPDVKKMSQNIQVHTDEWVSIKHFLMKRIAEKMKIYYDCGGTKTHFCEPESVRELVNYNQFLDSMYDIDERWFSGCLSADEARVQMELYDRNYERFSGDINGRVARKYLSDGYKRIFDEIMKKEVGRRAAYVVEMAQMRMIDSTYKLEIPKDYDRGSYTYGDFLECLYTLGRVSDYDKALIRCLMASFTSDMVREFICYRFSDGIESKKSLENLKKFLGNSFGNHWVGQIVPESIKDCVNIGYSSAELRQIRVSFPIGANTISGRKSQILRRIRTCLKNERIIPTMECIAMFFTAKNIDYGYREMFTFDVEIGPDEQNKLCLTFTGPNIDATLDVLGIVEKTLNYEEYREKMYRMFANSLANGINEFLLKSQDVEMGFSEKDFIETIREQSIHELIKWEHNGLPAYPFFDLDVSYNVIKRVREEVVQTGVAKIEYDECYYYIRNAYMKIGEMLKLQRTPYEQLDYSYDQVFLTCPFVEAFINCDKYLNPRYKHLLNETVKNVLTPIGIDWDSFTI